MFYLLLYRSNDPVCDAAWRYTVGSLIPVRIGLEIKEKHHSARRGKYFLVDAEQSFK